MSGERETKSVREELPTPTANRGLPGMGEQASSMKAPTVTQEVEVKTWTDDELWYGLLLLSGHQAGQLVILLPEQKRFVLGRGDDVDVFLDTAEISRHHAQLERQPDNSLVVVDLGSTNGVFVNQELVTRHVVEPNDRLQLGPHMVVKLLSQSPAELKSYQDMYIRSNQDTLTEVSNRKYFYDSLEQEWSFTKRHHLSLSLMMLDVDQLSAINYAHGHNVGDELLCQLTHWLQQTVRKEDKIGRWTGDGFVVLLREESAEGAIILAERLRETIATTVWNCLDQELSMTVSVGVVTWDASKGEVSPDELIRRVEECAEQAKQDGRNSTVACVLPEDALPSAS